MFGVPRPPHTAAFCAVVLALTASCGADEEALPTSPVDADAAIEASDILASDAGAEEPDADLADSAMDTELWPPDADDVAERDAEARDLDAAVAPEVVVPCEPIADEGCAAWETCTWASLDAEEPTCQPGGPGAPGDPCSEATGCSAGVCLALNETGSVCHALCEVATDCPDEAPCLDLEGLPFDVCEQWSSYVVCALLDPTDCPEGHGCYVVGTQPDPVCLVSGAGQVGELCDEANGCEAGGACAEGVCQTLCDPAAAEPCPAPLQTCALYYQGVGVCQD